VNKIRLKQLADLCKIWLAEKKNSADIWLSRILWNKQNPAESSKIYSPSHNKIWL